MVAEHKWSSSLLAAMSQEMQSMRQYMAQEQQRHAAEIQRHAQEIQRLQDRITMSKPNSWDTVNNYKNFKLFSGDQKEWDEFSTKFRSQVAAGERGVAALMESVESVMLEEQAEAKDWELVKDDQCPVEAVQEISVKLHNVLLSLTTGEANAAIRRCRGNGLWAWKKLSATLNPRTVASGVKAISQALNPGKITNATMRRMLRLTRTRSATSARARAKARVKEKGECWTCGEVGHRASECSKRGWYGKGGKGKSGQWNANTKRDGKGSKGGWTAPMVRACFGCGSTAHLIQDCPHRTTQKVQEVREEMEDCSLVTLRSWKTMILGKTSLPGGRLARDCGSRCLLVWTR